MERHLKSTMLTLSIASGVSDSSLRDFDQENENLKTPRHVLKTNVFLFFLAIVSSCFVLLPTFSLRCRVFFWPRDVSGMSLFRRRYTNIDSSCADRVLLRSLDLQSWGGETFRRLCGIQNDLQSIKHRE